MSSLSAVWAQPELLLPLTFIVGLAVGSFLNVVIHRLPLKLEQEWRQEASEFLGQAQSNEPPITLSKPRSRCPHCKTQLRVRDNIPLLSWLLLRGKCHACAQPISCRYPIVELATALLSVLCVWHFGYGWQALGALLLLWGLIALAGIDLDTYLLPDVITLPLLWLGLLFNLFGVFAPLNDAVIGAMAGYLVLWGIFWLFKLATGKEGMGYGDFKLLAALGAWMGWQMLPVVVLASSVVGASVGLLLIVFKGMGRDKPIPFGPYLAGAGVIALLWGQQLTQAYLQRL